VKSIFDFETQIPAIWQEELLCEELDNSMAVAILESYGPITLQIYNRCMELAGQYAEMKDLRSMFLTAAACRQKMNSSSLKTPVKDRNNNFLTKILDFYLFNLKMSKMDI
jgi:hypothetical protein